MDSRYNQETNNDINGTVCELVTSIRGNVKLNVDGFLYTKERNRDDRFYWICERRGQNPKCSARAITTMVNSYHMLVKHDQEQHNHAPSANRSAVLQACNTMKVLAKMTNDPPAQIVQNVNSRTDPEILPCMPSKSALRQQTKRARKECIPVEPRTLSTLDLPEEYRKTLSGEPFVKDITVGSERILLFTTQDNLRYLVQSQFWVMDGTFKTVPVLFRQLYTIHGQIGTGSNTRLLPLVYALMTSKSEELYKKTFHEIINLADEIGLFLQPDFIITDFEKAAVNAAFSEFRSSQNKGCFFHLGQSVYRKIQACGLAKLYGTNERFSLLVRHLPALAFLSPLEIPDAFLQIKTLLMSEFPNEAQPLLQYFEETYIFGRIIRASITTGNLQRSAPLFPPEMWSVHENVYLGFPRTQNKVEAWHRRLETLIGRAHVGIFTIIAEIQKEQKICEAEIEKMRRGEECEKRRKKDEMKEKRLQRIIAERESTPTLDFLRGIAHNVSF